MDRVHALADLPIAPVVAAIPKADLHVHGESDARIDRLLARRQGRQPYDWEAWARRLMVETPPGMPRLVRMVADRRLDRATVEALDADPDTFVARVTDQLEESAAAGAVLIEVRFGRNSVFQPDFMGLFREAERRARVRYPRVRATALVTGLFPSQDEREEQRLNGCLAAAGEGLGGIDFIPDPFDREADWSGVARWAERAADAGLGITAHAGEFSPANLATALQVPGLTRLGHAVHAATDPRLLDELARRQVTVECCLTCNVVLGAVPSYEEHPIGRFIEHGIPVTLNTDDPVRVGTTIGREYAVAAELGFSPADLLAFTRNAVRASFLPIDRRDTLLAELQTWEAHGDG